MMQRSTFIVQVMDEWNIMTEDMVNAETCKVLKSCLVFDNVQEMGPHECITPSPHRTNR